MKKPSREEAMKAVTTLIEWAGDDPKREGLVETPKRVVKAYEEFFAGYEQDPEEILQKTFKEVEGYDEMVLVKDIAVESHCEHHIAVVIDASHQCMSTRGIHKTESSTVTSSMRGIFKENPTTRNEFLNFIRLPK